MRGLGKEELIAKLLELLATPIEGDEIGVLDELDENPEHQIEDLPNETQEEI
jgi:hypothetical protein